MTRFLDVPAELASIWGEIGAALARVERRFDGQLRSDLPPVSRLVGHVERFRGKMLRPIMVIATGLAAREGSGRSADISDDHITCAAVCEMIHMATLVHDDVLDEAETRRRGETVNRLQGNEAAVILGDYLIASAYHLCSQIQSQRASLLTAHAAMVMCSGELLQLHHRGDLSLDEATYFEIVGRKTAALIGLSCRLGAICSGASDEAAARFERFGDALGVAFQIQDDVLDLTGRESLLGKPVGQDVAKGKLTLPVIHLLAGASPLDRGRSLRTLEEACAEGSGAEPARRRLVQDLQAAGSIEHARREAGRRVERAKTEIAPLAETPSKRLLLAMADAVATRAF